MVVADLMTSKPVWVQPDSTLSAAAQLMWQHDCGALPVVETTHGRVVGMLTDRDICMATWSRGLPPSAICASEAMSQHLVHCHPGETIQRAETIMHANQIRRLPVVDSDERLLGILSLADLARANEQAPREDSAAGLSSEMLATTLAGICRANGHASDGRSATRPPKQ